MFYKKIIVIFAVIIWSGILVHAADLESDLELESINFAFDSHKPVEDLKQIQRLVAFLNSDEALLVEICAHTDIVGTDEYNTRLSRERADAVKKILVDNGIAAERISIKGYASDKPVGSNSDVDGRLLNRRADFNIYKIKNGENYYYYKDNKLVRSLETLSGTASDKASVTPDGELMTKIDDLGNLIKDQNARMAEMAAAQEEQSELAASMKIIDTPICNLSVAMGSSDDNYAGRIQGSFFLPMDNQKAAFQAGFDGNIAEHLQEYQVNAGVVTKIGKFQLGCFGAVKFIKLEDYDRTGTLSQINVAVSRLFDQGSVGLFATEGIKSEDTIDEAGYYNFSDYITTETYLQLRDTYGLHFDYVFNNGFGFYGDIGGMNADDADVFAHLKCEYPVWEKYGLNLFLLTDYNSGLLEDNDNYAAFLGVEFSTSPRIFHNTNKIRPMEVQNISYELRTRTINAASGVNHPAQVAIQASAVQGGYPLSVDFTAIASDSDGTISSYEWNFGDGHTATGINVNHVFQNAGRYNVVLSVRDNKGVLSSASINIDSVNNAPTAEISPSTTTSGQRPFRVTFNGIATDTDGNIVDYSWDFGNGNTASGSTVTQTFYDQGIYIVKLTVTDDQGATASDAIEIFVYNWML